MKKCLFSILLLLTGQLVIAQIISQRYQNVKKTLHTDKKNVVIVVNKKQIDWGLDPKINPDRLRVYCENDSNMVKFYSEKDSLNFLVSKNDTISIKIIINNKDTANNEVIGIKDLPNQIKLTEKLFYFGKIWAEIKYNFVNIDKINFNLDSLYKDYLPKVFQTKNDYEYYQLVQRFVATFKDGHTETYSNQFNGYKDYFPMNIKDFDHKLYITSIKKSSETDSSWVGAEIIEISGIETKKYLTDSIFPYISASTKENLWMRGTFALNADLKWKPFSAKIKKSNGKTELIELKRNGESTRTENDQSIGIQPTYSNKIVEININDNKIAILTINSFKPAKKVIEDLGNELKKITNAKGLIIDLRRNGGGSTDVAHYLQYLLTSGNYFLNFGWETRINDGVGKANGNWIKEYEDFYLNKAYKFVAPDTVFVPDSLMRIKIPVAILIGRFTFSAAEDFLVNLYEVPNRPVFIGEETGGSTGSPLVIPDFPGGGYTRICTRRICFPYSTKRFVNQGIKPDIEVKQTLEDYLKGRDVVLEKALKIIKEKIK